jgi:hypothetical protein
MPSWTRPLFCVALLAAAVAGVGRYAAPGLCRSLGLDWWSLVELYRQAERESALRDELLRRDAVLRERVLNKSRVARLVIHDGLPLLEAAAWFKHFNDPACDADAEKLCRQVIDWARVEAEMIGRDGEAVAARLEAELSGHRGRGRLALPE